VERKRAAITLFGEVAFEFASVMENSEGIDHGVAAPPQEVVVTEGSPFANLTRLHCSAWRMSLRAVGRPKP
jgi:hypothetical protein